MSERTLEEPAYWRKLSSTGLTNSDDRGLSQASLTLIGYLEDTENTCFKSKDVSDMTYGTVTSKAIGKALVDIRNALEINDEEYEDWYWGERRGTGTLTTEPIRESLSEHSKYFFDWD